MPIGRSPNFWVFHIILDKVLAFVLGKLGFNIQAPATSFTGGLVGNSSPFAVLPQVKGKFDRMAIRPTMLYGTECWAVKYQHVHKIGVAEMRMFRWMCSHTRKDKIRNEDIRGKVRVAKIEGKMRENRLWWFGHVQRRPVDAPVRKDLRVLGSNGRHDTESSAMTF